MSATPPHIVIIGAGPGGLSTAMILKRKGYDVTLIERQSKVGGRTGVIEEDGYRFDIGPTFFLYPRILSEIFTYCGYDLWREVPIKRIDPMYRVVHEAGGHLDVVSGEEAMKAEIAKLSPADAENLDRYMKDNRKKLDVFRGVLENPFLSMADFMRPNVLKALPRLSPHMSLEADLNRYFKDPRVRRAFSFQAKYLGMSPFKCPSLFTILAFLEHEYGIWHPIGGCNAVMMRMGEIAAEMGVKVLLEEEVTSIQFDGKKARSVTTNKGQYDLDGLVVNADFAHVLPKLVPNEMRKKWNDKKIEAQEFSCSTFMLYLGIEGRLDNVPHHTIVLADDFEGNIDDIQERKVLPKDPSYYLQNASITDDTLAPKGHSTLYVLVPVPHRTANIDWKKEAASFREKTLDRLELAGVPDIRSRIRYEKVVTPDDWEADMHIYKGATFNLSHNLTQMLCFRPHNRYEDLERVYLVGGGTHPGSGLPVIFESARISSDLLQQDIAI
ncbi:MAG: phytoene desaturase family protein [Anderseniella sp.]